MFSNTVAVEEKGDGLYSEPAMEERIQKFLQAEKLEKPKKEKQQIGLAN